MMSETISIEKASACLIDLIHLLRTTDEVVITENQVPIARILRTENLKPAPVSRMLECGIADLANSVDRLAFKDYMP
jgi:hypothetical protein